MQARLASRKSNLCRKKQLKQAISVPKTDYDSNTSRKFYDLSILNINEQIHYQISSLMWDYDHNTLPSSLTHCFVRSSSIHNYKTRGALRGNYNHNHIITI